MLWNGQGTSYSGWCGGKSMSNKENLRWRLANLQNEIRPPYLRPENEQVLLPGWANVYINDAIREVWRSAFDEILEILDDTQEGVGSDQ
jgi:hypothetical protein